MIEFHVNPDLIGVIVGKKGARIKKIEEESGVSKINIDGRSGLNNLCVLSHLLH
jgi:transcription antitermination factor NusA-like protein